MAVAVTTVRDGVETVHATLDTLTGVWATAWEVWDKEAEALTDWTGVRVGPEVVVRYTQKGEK